MASFHALSDRAYVYDAAGEAHVLIGWLHNTGMSGDRFEPVVENPEGSGVGPWKLFHGDDPWTLS